MARPKKADKQKPPSAATLPEEISEEAFAIEMVKLRAFPPFRLLMAQWHNMRISILEAGKTKRNLDQWAVLDGFDRAIMEPDKWIDYAEKRTAQDDGAPTEGLDGGND